MTIYVGNIAYSMKEEDMKSTFSEYGNVESSKIIIDRQTGRSKGYGFVEMPNESEANAAVEALNDREVAGRRIKVNLARPRD
ncbi:MAG: RNA-binding protein [Prevotellaceae bacterium]|jgi:RNA recognition motif-containing protein|nr:RNA-binding protein [Prevotellaceae bacterium]